MQIPFEAEHALRFARYVQRHYGIPDDHILNVGDETDGYHAGQWPKDPNSKLSAKEELSITKQKIAEWGAAFPKMKLAVSNHGLRWVRKATAAEIPQEVLRSYKEIIGAPEGWHWANEWIIKTKHPFRIIHGLGYSGLQGHRNAAIDAGMSTAIGHLHSFAGISTVRTGSTLDLSPSLKIWGMNTGCLIDIESFAFFYGKEGRQKPALGLGVVFNEGSTPVWLPYD